MIAWSLDNRFVLAAIMGMLLISMFTHMVEKQILVFGAIGFGRFNFLKIKQTYISS